MPVFRAMWCGLAAIAAVFAFWVGTWPMSQVSLECSKIYTPENSDGCAASIVSVLGVWHIAGQAAALVLPSTVAAVAMRRWVSWFAVATFAGVAVIGVMNWTGFWGTLMFAALLFLASLLLAGVQQLVGSDDERGRGVRSA